MNTITIDQFQDIITKFNLTTDIKYEFKLTKKSKKPICFHTRQLNETHRKGHLIFKCNDCGEEFTDAWGISETDLKNELKSEAIQIKKILLKTINQILI